MECEKKTLLLGTFYEEYVVAFPSDFSRDWVDLCDPSNLKMKKGDGPKYAFNLLITFCGSV
jgi:hypothetical protein